MLRIILLDFMLRACVAPRGFALGSFPRDGFLLVADPMERGDYRLGDVKSIIGIIPPLSAFLLERDPSEASLAGTRPLLEEDLAAIEDGTGASFTVGSSPTSSPPACPCHAG